MLSRDIAFGCRGVRGPKGLLNGGFSVDGPGPSALANSLLNQKGQPFFGWPKSLTVVNLEGEVSIENHGAVRPSVSPSLAKCTWRSSSGIHTVDVAIVDVEPWYSQELVVESVESIGTKLQAEALVQLEVLSHCQIQLVACHGAEVIATRCAREWISTAYGVNGERVVHDEVNIRGINKRTSRRSRQRRALAVADVD